jgi:hypothetical protein
MYWKRKLAGIIVIVNLVALDLISYPDNYPKKIRRTNSILMPIMMMIMMTARSPSGPQTPASIRPANAAVSQGQKHHQLTGPNIQEEIPKQSRSTA